MPSQGGQHAAQVHERLPGRRRDGLLRPAAPVRVRERGQHGRLHGDHGEPVGDDVVQLHRDPLPLGLGRLAHSLLLRGERGQPVPGAVPDPAHQVGGHRGQHGEHPQGGGPALPRERLRSGRRVREQLRGHHDPQEAGGGQPHEPAVGVPHGHQRAQQPAAAEAHGGEVRVVRPGQSGQQDGAAGEDREGRQ